MEPTQASPTSLKVTTEASRPSVSTLASRWECGSPRPSSPHRFSRIFWNSKAIPDALARRIDAVLANLQYVREQIIDRLREIDEDEDDEDDTEAT